MRSSASLSIEDARNVAAESKRRGAVESFAMRFSRGLLWLNVVLFAVYGLAYLLVPDLLTSLIAGTSYPNAAVAIDARAVYGGMPLGLATLLALLARGGRDFQSVGQLGCAALFGGVATGRLAGMIVTQSFSPLMISVFVSEIVFAALSGYAFALLRARTRPLRRTTEKT
jgi:hypothetical protein